MYAQRTKVPQNQSRAEIERLLERRGATNRIVGTTKESVMLMFEMQGWRLKFILPLVPTKRRLTDRQLAQEARRRWRALLLVIKAKLEAVDSGIVEFAREFMPFIVTNARNETVADQYLAGLPALVSGGKGLPPLLGPGGGDDE